MDMTINQLSIFIENRSGTLIKVLDVLKQAGIQIIASTIADTAEYGIYRLICSEPTRAYEELKALHEKYMFSYSEKVEALEEAEREYKKATADARNLMARYKAEVEAQIAQMRQVNTILN